MEHQVFVPVPADDLRAVLRDPVRTARCVPGFQQDADTDTGPLSGRLKARIGGHTVTYRGSLAVTERDPDRFAVEGEGTEARGSGTVKLSLLLRLTPQGDGTRLEFTGGATVDGRAAGFAPEATAIAVQRLLDRTAAQLAATAGAAVEPVADAVPGADAAASDRMADAEEADREGDAEDAGFEADTEDTEDAEDAEGTEDDGVTASVFDTDVPPPSLDPFLEGEFGGVGGPARPPAEAAHARRTMIGRSAEEVDHAPPRGRYAPVPAPAAGAAGVNLRWLAPAAALAVASAVVVGRVLRRRR
ncbi:SRPBCC domain-containing protein [Streptomyces sp. NBC_00513]|uniref:SRPBCC domain-containing protein n=1 Tax=unclassified Streptomyces TaxID=2593676 RepID=UPI002254EC31|nr:MULTISPECIES: SRPBCC domain-containing protein [unclassified Streptomyces]MCX5074639.1 SRPBCC domain-containing protein [Streptomyces sp. NBC_00424]MCX5153808.1 SRPBCC domain-containing protein [Streptomyces sp. NBC_00291]WUD42186.1 SRPBCC domain-containing protein [Streptomyces sp. NBC_00513]